MSDLQARRAGVRARGETWHTVHGRLDVSWRDADARLVRTALRAHADTQEYAVAALPERVESYRRAARADRATAHRYEQKAEALQALHDRGEAAHATALAPERPWTRPASS